MKASLVAYDTKKDRAKNNKIIDMSKDIQNSQRPKFGRSKF